MPAQADPPVLILTGPPGAGKTTTAELLAARTDSAVHLEADLFFSFIRSGFVEPWRPESHEQNGLVMRIVGETAAAYAGAGYFTIVDGIVIPRRFLGPVRAVLAEAGHVVALAVLRPSLATCEEHVGREGGPLAEPGVVRQLWTEFAQLGDYERNAIELGEENPDEAADTVARLLAEGKLTV